MMLYVYQEVTFGENVNRLPEFEDPDLFRSAFSGSSQDFCRVQCPWAWDTSREFGLTHLSVTHHVFIPMPPQVVPGPETLVLVS